MGKERGKERRLERLISAFTAGCLVFATGCAADRQPTPTPTKTRKFWPTLALPATFTPTPTETLTPTGTSTPAETSTPTETSTETPTPSETPSPTPTNTPTPSPTPSRTPTLIPTHTSTPSLTPTPTPEKPTFTPTPEPRREKLVKFKEAVWSENCQFTGIKRGSVFDQRGNPVNNFIFIIENEWGYQTVTHESGAGRYGPGEFDLVHETGQEGVFTLRPYAIRMQGEANIDQTSEELLAEIKEHSEYFYLFNRPEVDEVILSFDHCEKGSHQSVRVEFVLTRDSF